MKKLIFLLAVALISLNAFSQRDPYNVTIYTPVGDDTIVYSKEFTGNSWSSNYWAKYLSGGDDTLYIWGSNFHPDSGAWDLIWVDKNNDGTNDNPHVFTDSVWAPWGDSFPFIYFIQEYRKGSSTAGDPLFNATRKQ